MNEKTRMFTGAFAITLILLLFCAGFIAVDLSTGRYMPDAFGSFFEITGITPEGVDFTAFSQGYHYEFPLDSMGEEFLVRARGLLPMLPLLSAEVAAQAVQYWLEKEYGQGLPMASTASRMVSTGSAPRGIFTEKYGF